MSDKVRYSIRADNGDVLASELHWYTLFQLAEPRTSGEPRASEILIARR